MSKVTPINQGQEAIELQKLVAQDKAERIEKVKAGIDAIMAKERCQLVPGMILTAGNVSARIDIVALD